MTTLDRQLADGGTGGTCSAQQTIMAAVMHADHLQAHDAAPIDPMLCEHRVSLRRWGYCGDDSFAIDHEAPVRRNFQVAIDRGMDECPNDSPRHWWVAAHGIKCREQAAPRGAGTASLCHHMS